MDNELIASHSEDVQETPTHDAFAEFGITPTVVEEPTEELDIEEQETEEDPPVIVEPTNVRKVKFNKGDYEVQEDEIDELLQKGLALPKERERKEQYETALKRAAKLAGYDDVNTYLTELDTIEQKAIEHKSNEIDTMKQQMLQEYADAGGDPAQLEAYIDNHPLFQKTIEITEREKQTQKERIAQEKEREINAIKEKGWTDFFIEYPDLAESVQNNTATWYTPELQAKIDRGYDPIDAYESLNRGTIKQNQRQLAEQAVITQQRLNKRAPLSAETVPTSEADVPASVRNAFAEFGLDPKEAQKYYKK